MDRKLQNYLPPILRGNRELGAITQAEQPEIEQAWQAADIALCNQFISTATQYGLDRWEKMLGIAPLKTDTLDFRRDRVRNRINLQMPFTLEWLNDRLDALLGEGQWTVEMDYANYTLYIESEIQNQPYVQEVAVTLHKVKPCNIVYINRPVMPDGLLINESIRLSYLEHNYLLGSWRLGLRPFAWEGGINYHYALGGWALGAKPFAHEDEKGVVKLASQPSIQPALAEDVTGFIRDHVTAARINGTILVRELTKAAYGHQLIVTYAVHDTQADTVTRVELLDGQGDPLAAATVLVPVEGSVVFKHTISTKEGV